MKNFKLFTSLLFSVIVLAIALQFSCGDSTEAPIDAPKEYSSGLSLENMDKTVKPGDNFQMYVNGKWIKETEIPSDKSNYGIFAVLNDKAQEDVKKIIEFAASSENNDGSDEFTITYSSKNEYKLDDCIKSAGIYSFLYEYKILQSFK